MVGLREIPRTATFAWSPSASRTFLATGTRAGAVDEGFSNDTQLELWDLKLDNGKQSEELQPTAKIETDSRFHDIAWAPETDDHPQGVIAGALENGSLDLWDAEKLMSGDNGSLISRTSNHAGAIKALQFNPFRTELLATSGAKGELFLSDLNNINKPFRIGNAVARGGDFDCLDWNKKVSHILATGSSEGFVTVWDVKTKKESLTLNNYSRKPASAVAWDPEKHTRLVTAIPSDTDPLILVWDLRNANAPERIIRGHDGGVLSLSWCPQDTDLLLSSGKDNRTICWNPNAMKPQSEYYGDFPVVTNWTFQTRWSPHNPSFLATASFDGKISVQSIQNTGSNQPSAGNKAQATDDEDFFSKAQSEPQAASFSLKKAPRWLERPCGASFGFGGKIISYKNRKTIVDKPGEKSEVRQGSLRISTFVVDVGVGTSTEIFENALKQNNLSSICNNKISEAKSDAEKADWEVIRTMTAENPRKALVDHLGFTTNDDEALDGVSKLAINGEQTTKSGTNGTSETKFNRLSAFFENTGESDGFLSDLAATKGAKTNNPFQIYTGSESDPDRRITRALLLGQFEKALDVCLQEKRISDAFMIAICGGPSCIEKTQKAYFNTKSQGPNYLRLLASVVGKNLWDIVYNADLANWKEVMATLCTYAGAEEFPDLCEALGDRMEDQMKEGQDGIAARKDAAFCYLAGSKLEKAVALWIADMQEQEGTDSLDIGDRSSFSAHAKLLQNLIEKVTIFREVTDFEDKGLLATSDWKLSALYDLYTEYADVLASQGQLQTAERYLDLLPDKYPAAEVAKNRVKQATKKAIPQQATRQPAPTTRATAPRNQPNMPDFQSQQAPNQTRQPAATIQYAPAQPQNPYASMGNGPYGGSGQPGYQPNQMQQPPQQQGRMVPPPMYASSALSSGVGPPPRNLNASPSIPPPSKATNMTNWNDLPEDFIKPPTTSRRGTPGIGPGATSQYAPAPSQSYGGQQKPTPPLPPPPKGFGGPPRTSSPATTMNQSSQPSERPSSAANAYAPQQAPQTPNQSQRPPPVPRGTSPYNAPPSAPPPSNRYAPAPSAPFSQPEPSNTPISNRQGPPPPNPYAPQQSHPAQQTQQQYNMQAPGQGLQQPAMMQQQGAPSPPQGPPQTSRPNTAQSQRGKSTLSAPRYPPGDRSHIPANAQPVYEILNADFQRVKAKAPSTFKAHVNDAEKRLNILYDHLNNEDLLKADTIESMSELARALQARDYEQAQGIHVEILTNKTDECGNWMVGVKRLIAMSRSTP